MKKITVLILAVVFAAAAFAEGSVKSLYASAIVNYKAKKYTEAIKELDQVIKIATKPQDKLRAIDRKARCLRSMKKYEDAADTRMQILDFKDVTADQKVQYVVAAIKTYLSAKNNDKAQAVADKLSALELTSDRAKQLLAYNKSYLLNRQRKYDEVHALLDPVLKNIDPKSRKRYNIDSQKMTAFLGQRNYQGLIDALPDSFIKQVTPKTKYGYYYYRAIAYYKLKKYPEAAKDLDECLKCRPGYKSALYYKKRIAKATKE